MSQRTHHKTVRRQPFALRPISLAACLLGAAPASFGLPQGAVANGGQASVSLVTPTQLQINQTTPRAGLDWTSFSIAAGERVNITQPSARAVLINRVLGNDPSQIHGALSSNGQVWLVNPRGVYFGPQSQVDVGGLLATTLAIGQQDIHSGRLQLGSLQADAGELRAEGSITASDGSVLLVAPRLLQSGRVLARRVGLAAASEVLVDVEGDGLVFFNARNDRLDARLSVLGKVLADGGTAELRAAARAGFADTVLNLEGVVRARSLGQRNGQIVVDGGSDGITRIAGTIDATGTGSGRTAGDVLVLGRKVMLDTSAVVDASAAAGGGRVRVGGGFQGGDVSLRNSEMVVARAGSRIDASALDAGDGGQVVLWADGATRFHGAITARGGAGRGDGGNVEVSGKQWLDFNGTVDTAAAAGAGGTLLLDPLKLTIRESTPDINGADVAGAADLAGQTLGFTDFVGSPESFITAGAVNAQLAAGAANVILDAQDTITVEAGATEILGAGQLTLRAGNGITIARDITAINGITLSANHTAISAADTGFVQLGANLSASGGGINITNNGGTGTHQLGGNLSANSVAMTGAATLTANASWTIGAGGAVIAGAIGESGGSRGIDKLGAGVLELQASNSYTGTTTVSAGTLRISGAAATAGSGTIALGASTLDIAGGANVANTLTVSNGATVTNTSGTGTLAPTSPAVALAVPAGATLNLASSATGLTVSRQIGGSGGVTKAGAGTVVLSGSNSFSGPLQIDAGTLQLSGGSALADTVAVTLADVAGARLELATAEVLGSLAGGGGSGGSVDLGALTLTVGGNNTSTSYGGVIAGASGRLVKQGSGVLSLTAANTYSGGSTVSGGTLAVSGGGIAGSGTIALGANRLDINSGATVINALTVSDGATVSNSSGSGTLDAPGTLTLGDGATLNLTSSGTSLTVNRLIADSNDNATVAVTGSAPVTLGNAGNSYGGSTSTSLRVSGGGTLAVAAAGALGNAGVLTLDNATLRATSGFTFGRDVTLAAGGGVFDVPTAGQTLSLSGDVTGPGDATKTGNGTLALAGSNAYDETRFNGGVLSVAGANDLGLGGLTFAGGTLRATNSLTLGRDVTINAAGGAIDVDNGETLALANAVGGAGSLVKSGGSGTLVLQAASSHAGTTVSAGTLTLRNLGTVGSGNVLLDGATSTLRNERSTTLVIAGTISGTGRLQQAGTGVTQLEGANSYSGGTTVSDGTLRISGASATAGVGGTLALDNKTLDIANGATVASLLTVTDGATISNSAGAAGTLSTTGGPLALANGSNLNLTASGSGLIVDRQITDGGASNSTLTITGTAPVTLSNPGNSYGGDTLIGTAGAPDVAGTLKLTDANAASGAAIELRTGASVLDISNGITLAKPVTMAASNTTITSSSGGTLDSTGTLALGNGVNLNLSSTAGGLTVNRQVTDSNNNATLTVTGSARVTLGHTNNTHGGGTNVVSGGSLALAAVGSLGNAGVLTLDNGSLLASETLVLARDVTLGAGGGSFDVAATKTLTLPNTHGVGGGSGSLTKAGAGTLVLAGANSYGATSINGGVVSVGAANNLGSAALSFGGGTLATSETFTLSGLTFNAGGASFDVAAGKTLTLQDSSGAGGVTKTGAGTLVLAGTSSYAGNTTVDAGTLGVSGVFNAAGGITLGANTLDISGGASVASALTVADGATISNSSGAGTLSATGGPLTLGAGVNNLNLASTGSGLVVAREIADTGNTSTLTITGSAPVTLSNGANSYGGNTLVGTAGAPDLAGTLKLAHADAASGAAIELRTGVSVLDISNGITLAKLVTVAASNATITNSQGSGTLDNSGTLALGTAFNLRLSSTAGGLVVNRQITDTSNDATIAVSGSAPVALGNLLNSHGGGNSVGGGGSLSVSAAGNLGDGGGLALDNGSLLATAGFTLAREITLGAGGGSFDVANAATLTLLNPVIGASGSLAKTGAGTLVLAGANSYGATDINGGVLSVSAAANIGSGALALNGGTLAATETLALARNVTLNPGGGTFDVSSGKTLTLSNPVGGASGNLGKTGAGTLVLGATGSYAATTVNAGVLSLAAADRLGSGGVSFGGGTLHASQSFALARNVTLDAAGGSFDVAGGKTLTLSNAVAGVGDLNKLGAGTLVLANTNSHAATRLNAGTLSVSAAGNLGLGALVFDGGNLSASGSFTLARDLTLNAGGGGIDTSAGATTLTLANPVGGVGALSKSGAGTLVLAASNSYSGGTTVNAGSLRVAAGGAAGSGSIALGANTLDIAGGATVSNTLTLTSGATITNSLGTGTLDHTGTLALADGANLNLASSAGGLIIARSIDDAAGSARITVSGGSVTLTADNSFDGGSTVDSGATLQLGAGLATGNAGSGAITNSGLLKVDRNNTLTIGAVINGSGQLEQAGSGSTLLTAANSYSGGSTVNNGTLVVSGIGAAAGSSAIVLANPNAVLDIVSGASVANAVTSNGALVANTAGSGELAGSLTLAANSRLSSTGGGLTINGAISDGSSGFGIEKIGTGSVTLASAGNSYRGNTTLSAGTLRTSGDQRIADNSAVVVNAGELALGGSETIASLAGGGGTVSVPVALRVGAAGSTTSYAGVFSGSGAVEKIGAGTLGLASSSGSHSGSVTVSEGTLALNVANALGSGSRVVVAGGTLALAGNHQSVAGVALQSGSITGSGGSLTSASNFDLQGGSISAGLAGATGGVGLDKTTSGSVVLSGAATYGGDTTVSAGTLSLAAASALPATTRLIVNGGDFDIGALAVTVGQLQLQSGSVTGSGTLTAGQYLVSGGTSSVGLGAGVLDSSGLTTLTGAVQASQINVNAGVLTLAQDNVLSGGGRTVTVAGSATLVNNGNNQAGQLNLAGTLAGTGSFSAGAYALDGGSVNAALGGGALTSTGSSTINANVGADSVVVAAGQLSVGSGGQLTNNNASVAVQTGATLQLSGDENVGQLALAGSLNTASGVNSTLTALNYALASGSVNTPLGGGALTSTGSSSLNAAVAAGTVSVDSGVLALNQAQQLTAAPAVSVVGGATLALAADQTIGLLSGAGAVTMAGFTLASGSGGNSSFQGTISGSGTLLKQGSSTFTLEGDNPHARTRIAGGSLALAAAGHLADTSELQVDAGATLQLAADETIGSLSLAGTLAAATGTTPTLTAANVALAGATVNSALGAGTLTSTGSSALNATIGAATVAVDGGTLTLNLAQQLTARPALRIAAGAVLALAADQTLGTLSGAGTAALASHTLATGSGGGSSFEGVVSGSGTLLKQGLSTFTLSGDNQHAQTRVAAGTLLLAAAQRLADTSSLRVDSGATLQLGGDQTVASLALAGTLAGSGTLHAASYSLDGGTANAALGGGALTSSGSSVVNATLGAGSVAVDSGRLTLGAPQLLSPLAEVTVASGAVLELNGIDTAARLVLRGMLAGSGTLTAADYELHGGTADANLGPGTLASRGHSTLRGSVAAGLVNVLDGDLRLSTAQQLQQLPEVNIFGGARVTLAADQGFGRLAGSGQLDLATFTLASGAGGDSSFAGVIGGDGGFIKRGASVFTLSGANSWRGRTVVEQGTLRVGDNASAGSLGSGDVEVHGTLAMARSDSVTLAQAISGSGSVEQHGGGSGRLLLSGNNKTYSGATRVLSGELATAGADNLPDTSAVSVAAGASLALGGRETLQSVAADGSVSLAGDLVAAGDLALRGAVTVPGNQTIVLSGTRIDAVNPGNRWGAALGFDARDRITLSSGLDGNAKQRPLTLSAFSAAAGGRIDAGALAIDGNGSVSGGQLVLASDSAQTAAPAGDIPPGKLVQSRPVAYTADTIVQGANSRLEVGADAELSLLTPNGASIQLGRLDNRFNGRVSAIAGSPTAAWSLNDGSGTALQNRVRIGGDTVNVGGAGVVADVVEINADTLATRGDSALVARLPFDRDVGTTVSLPALTLILTQRSFTLTFPYGNTGVEGLRVNVGSRSWGPRTSGPDAGYITVLPRGGGASGNTSVLLAGPNVNAGGYGFFFDGASVQGEVPVYYNGVLPATPQVENSISATVAVSEAARKQRFDEAVRTENVALRLRAGVIAEVGPAPSATQGPEGGRLPASCAPAAGSLRCAAKP